MISNCSPHLRTTIEALQPTVIHSQGRAAGSSTHQAVERVVDQVSEIDEHVARVRIGEVEAIWCSLKHPGRNWGQLGRRYLHEVAAPALATTRRLALDPRR
jgi:hypothetical protein